MVYHLVASVLVGLESTVIRHVWSMTEEIYLVIWTRLKCDHKFSGGWICIRYLTKVQERNEEPNERTED